MGFKSNLIFEHRSFFGEAHEVSLPLPHLFQDVLLQEFKKSLQQYFMTNIQSSARHSCQN